MTNSPDADAQLPQFRHEPPRVSTDGDHAAFLSSAYGLTPDPWQKAVLDSWLARRADGSWASIACGLAIPRQNGKNGVLEMRELYGMIANGESFLHSAHQVRTTKKAFKRLSSFFTNPRKYPELHALLDGEPRETNGQEAIRLKNGGSCEFISRSKSSGRGYTVDCLVMDEAQEMSDDALEALMPTTSSAPLRNPQWIFTGTPPGPQANGEVFSRIREAGLKGSDPRLSWYEWSALDPGDLDDRDVWRRVNPALITGRLLWDVVEAERERFSDEGFARERLGVWASENSNAVVDAATWRRLADGEAAAVGEVAYGIDVSPSRGSASIGMAGWTSEGRLLVEFVEGRNSADWVVAVATRINEAQRPRAFVIDRMSQAADFIQPLSEAGLPVVETGAAEYGRACARFYDAAMTGLMVHLDQPPLNVALSQASKRDIGAEGLWGWNRKKATSDITPLVAVTLAIHGLSAEPKNLPKRLSSLYAF